MSEPSEAEMLRLIRRGIAELEWPERERMLRAGRTRPRNRREWDLFARDLLGDQEAGAEPPEDTRC
jgi:hypothetical protein